MPLYLHFIIIVVCIIMLAKGASWLVESSVNIANWLKIPELVIGLTIVAFGTSAPEFGVTLLSGIKGMGDVAIGNVVGSNIFNLGFILGGTALFGNLRTTKPLIYRDGFYLLLGTVILTFMMWDLSISRTEGIILFSMLFLYLGYLIWKKEPVEDLEEIKKVSWKDFVFLPLGLTLILVGAHYLVDSSVTVAREFGISEWVIGATIIAFGTSAPELATSITAAIKGHHGLSIGNLIGSDIFNMYGVLGLTAIINNMNVDVGVKSNLILLIGMILLTLIFLRSKWRLSRWEGGILVAIGLARWIYSFL